MMCDSVSERIKAQLLMTLMPAHNRTLCPWSMAYVQTARATMFHGARRMYLAKTTAFRGVGLPWIASAPLPFVEALHEYRAAA